MLEKYKHLVFETADFMASYATYDPDKNRYNLVGIIPAQETFKPETTFNSPYELAYWHWGLNIAQQWRVRLGMGQNRQWDDIIEKLAVLAQKNGIYLSAESAPDSYTNLPFHSDHPAVLGALGFLPESRVVNKTTMNATFDYVWDHWNWKKNMGLGFSACCHDRYTSRPTRQGHRCPVHEHPYQYLSVQRSQLPGQAVKALPAGQRRGTCSCGHDVCRFMTVVKQGIPVSPKMVPGKSDGRD